MASGNVITLNETNFKETINGDGLTLVDFWAEWCGPCKMIAPEVEKLADEMAGKAKIAKLNVDENRSIAGEYQVMSIPTMILFKEGKEIERVIGFRKKDELKKLVEKHL